MTRETYDACIRWNDTDGADAEKATLLARLRAELPARVVVESLDP